MLSKLQSSVPECVAAGLVDLISGMLLGVRTVDSHPQDWGQTADDAIDTVQDVQSPYIQTAGQIRFIRAMEQYSDVHGDSDHENPEASSAG